MSRLVLVLFVIFLATPSYPEDLTLCREGWNKSTVGDQDEAISLYNKCIETGDLTTANLAQAFRNIAIANKKRGSYKQALEFHDLALALNPKDPWADYVNKGIVYLKMREYSQTLQNYNKALELKPGFAPAYFGRGELFEIEGDTQKAIIEYQKAYDAGWREKPLYGKMIKHGLITGQ